MSELQIPGFDVIELIGRGGMASVWKARQVSLDRMVAIKVLSAAFSGDPADVERFQDEARAAARLKHQGIVQVYDASAQEGLYYFVMEYVAGYTVGSWVRRKGALKPRDVLVVAECVADALGYAWEHAGLIHCDIKPDNIIIDADGTVKVADLGLSRTINAMARHAEESDEVMGTPSYIAPEQAMGEPDLDCRTDIYSLGAMMYHLVTGRRPFEACPDGDILAQQCSGHLDNPVDLCDGVPVAMAELIRKMMARNKADRHAGWQEVKTDIARAKHGHGPKVPLASGSDSTVRGSATTTRRLRRDAGRAALARPPQRDVSPILIAAVAGGLVCLLLAAYLIYRATHPFEYSAPPAPVVSSQGRPPPSPVVDAKRQRDEQVEARLREVQRWMADHPEDVAGALTRLRALEELADGSPSADKVAGMFDEVRRRQTRRIEAVIQALHARAAPLVDADRLLEAARVYQSYDGEYAQATEAQRMSIAASLCKQAAAAAGQRDAAAGTQDFGTAAQIVADDILDSGPEIACRRAREWLRENPTAGGCADMQSLAEVLERAARLDETVMKSFEASMGETITVQLVSGDRRILIKDVSATQVAGLLQVRTAGVTAGRQTSFVLKDLSVRERLTRMGDDSDPAVAIGKGLMALDAGAYSHARRYFSSAPASVAGRLAARVAEIESSPEERARDPRPPPAPPAVPEGQAAAPVAPPAVPEEQAAVPVAAPAVPVAPVRDDIRVPREYEGIRNDVEAVQRALCARNPGVPAMVFEPEEADGVCVGLTVTSGEVMDVSPVAALTSLKRFSYSPPRGEAGFLKDIGPLSELRLESVAIINARVQDLSPLRTMPLTQLNLQGCPVRDLVPLRGLPIEKLDLSRTQVLDVSSLSSLPIREINLSETPVRRLFPLAGLPLIHVKVSHVGATDFSWLSGLKLESLELDGAPIRSFDLLKGMPLNTLRARDAAVGDLAGIAAAPLKVLDISGAPARDGSALAGLKLSNLDVSRTGISSLAFVKGMELQSLSIHDTSIADLTPLQGMSLTVLDMRNCRVTDVGPLKGMPITVLLCSGCRVGDFSPLAGAPIVRLDVDDPLEHKHFIDSLRDLTHLNGENLLLSETSPFRRRG